MGKMALHADSNSPWSWDRFGVGDLEFGIWGEGELVREVREREVMGESESEGERESDIFYLNDCGAQRTKII